MAQKKGGSRRRTATTAKNRKRSSATVRKKRQSAAEQPLFLREEALPLLFGLLAVLLLLGNFGLCGALGAVLRDVQLGLFGSPGLLFPLLLCGIVMHSLLSGDKERAARKNTALLLSYVFLIVLVHLLQGTEGGDLAYLYA
ncbi:DNA translocase FtsK 4TM domain-containing protein, partial [Stomatobaculum longum]